jgi:hypothetical protein
MHPFLHVSVLLAAAIATAFLGLKVLDQRGSVRAWLALIATAAVTLGTALTAPVPYTATGLHYQSHALGRAVDLPDDWRVAREDTFRRPTRGAPDGWLTIISVDMQGIDVLGMALFRFGLVAAGPAEECRRVQLRGRAPMRCTGRASGWQGNYRWVSYAWREGPRALAVVFAMSGEPGPVLEESAALFDLIAPR